MPAHKNNTKDFDELTPQEQAKSISAQILNVEAVIKHRVSKSDDKTKVRDGCVQQIDNLLARIKQIPI